MYWPNKGLIKSIYLQTCTPLKKTEPNFVTDSAAPIVPWIYPLALFGATNNCRDKIACWMLKLVELDGGRWRLKIEIAFQKRENHLKE